MNSELDRKLTEKTLSSQELYHGTVVHLFRDEVSLPGGGKSSREYLRHPGAVCIIPILDNKEILIEYQYRYAQRQILLEIPAGKMEYEEEPLACALRELEEETGYIAGKMVFLGEYLGSPAIMGEKIYMYAAMELKRGEIHRDRDEFIELSSIPLSELVRRCAAGEIPDGKTQVAAFKLSYLLENNLI